MYPGMMAWWKWKTAGHHAHCGPHAGHGGCGEGGGEAHASGDEGDFGGGSFGVRRPLRFLAHKLDLDDKQVAELAHILNELKTERAQAAVDHQRTVSAFADAIEGDAFDDARAQEGAKLRLASAERLREAVVKALSRIHALLTKEQREKFAYLIRTGIVSM